MAYTDRHVHTVFSDGVNTPEEIVKRAVELKMEGIGFSDHSYTSFDKSYCLKDEAEYKKTILDLKEKFKDKIKIYLGIEQDYYADNMAEGFDYIIGSVHYLKVGDEYFAVDEEADILRSAAKKYFNGDIYSLIELYFETVADVVNKTGANIIGHFDLISKFNNKNKLFDETADRYVKAYKKAIDKLVKTGAIFEINTGAIYRGLKKEPYPNLAQIEYIKKSGGKFILSSDSHEAGALTYKFDDYKKYL